MMDYEAGLEKLKKYIQGTDGYLEYTTYEARLRSILDKEGLYGSAPQNNAERGEAVAQLNRFALRYLNKSFNDLCMPQPPVHPNASPLLLAGEQQTQAQGMSFNIFISYHEKDLRYLRELQTHLNQYVKQGISYWDSTKIVPGRQKDLETAQALSNADMAIILVSADYLSPNKRIDHELPVLLQREQREGKKILCIIVRPCAFEYSDLAQFAPLNNPDQALSRMKFNGREEVWARLAAFIKEQIGKE